MPARANSAISSPSGDIASTDRAIDTLVYQLYGLIPAEIKIVEGGWVIVEGIFNLLHLLSQILIAPFPNNCYTLSCLASVEYPVGTFPEGIRENAKNLL